MTASSPAHEDIAELKKIRIAQDWSYERLAREIGSVTTAALFRLLKGETQPSEKTQRHLRAFVAKRTKASRRPL
jgi:transcriptional regulator with XRE-family HTH domain